MNLYEREYEFILEIWEINDAGKKLIGTRPIAVKAEFDAQAISKAWTEANGSLTHNYFYSLRFKY